jgi:hypothetical protein
VAKKNRDALAWGIILVVIGAILLFGNLDLDIWNYTARLWPLILIFWGGWKLYYGLQERNQKTGAEQDQP